MVGQGSDAVTQACVQRLCMPRLGANGLRRGRCRRRESRCGALWVVGAMRLVSWQGLGRDMGPASVTAAGAPPTPVRECDGQVVASGKHRSSCSGARDQVAEENDQAFFANVVSVGAGAERRLSAG